MAIKRPALIPLLFVVLFTARAHQSDGQEPTRLSTDGVHPAVWGVLKLPSEKGPHPGVVILHGSLGWRQEFADYASALADSGFVALTVNHHADLDSEALSRGPRYYWAIWQNIVRNAVAYLKSLPCTKGQNIGLVGFS